MRWKERVDNNKQPSWASLVPRARDIDFLGRGRHFELWTAIEIYQSSSHVWYYQMKFNLFS